jgi:iron(III) transport system substrate-binding protein
MTIDLSRRDFGRFALGGVAAGLLGSGSAADAAAWDDLVRAAEREGKLALLGPTIEPYRVSLMQFQTAYPKIELEYNGSSASDFQSRIRTERRAGLFLWDVIVTGVSGAVFTRQLKSGWFDPLRPLIVRPDILDDRRWLGGFASGFVDTRQQYLYAFQAGYQRNIYIDRSAIPLSQLHSLSGLLDPRWRGKIAMFDPRVRGGGHTITLLIAVLGEDAARRFLVQQKPVFTTVQRQITEWAMRGAYPITSGMSPSEHALWQARGLGRSVEPLVLPPQQSPWTPGNGVLGLLNGAPHPNAAKLFVNWLLSREAQIDWAKRGRVNSRRLDVPVGLPASHMTADAFDKGISFNREEMAKLAQRAETLAREVLG